MNQNTVEKTIHKLPIMFALSFLAIGTVSASPAELPGRIGFSGSGSISELTGLAIVADVVFDLPFHAIELDGPYAPLHSWQNFEGPAIEILGSQKIWQFGVGYRKVLRFFEFLPFGFGLSVGVSTTESQNTPGESDHEEKMAPYVKFDGTILGIALGMDVVLDSQGPQKNGFLLGVRF